MSVKYFTYSHVMQGLLWWMMQSLRLQCNKPCLVQQARFGIAFIQPYRRLRGSMLAEFEDWHSDVKWMQQTVVWPAALTSQFEADTDLSKHCILLQPHHITAYCQQFTVQSNRGVSQHDIARRQRLLTAVSRVSMHQRMQIVFMGYRGRFAEVGVCTRGESCLLSCQNEAFVMLFCCPHYFSCLCICYGMQSHDSLPLCTCCSMLADDIAFLDMSDVDTLNLPKLARDTVTAYIQHRLCRPPLVLDCTSTVTDLTKSTKVTCQRLLFLLGACVMFANMAWVGICADWAIMLAGAAQQLSSWELPDPFHGGAAQYSSGSSHATLMQTNSHLQRLLTLQSMVAYKTCSAEVACTSLCASVRYSVLHLFQVLACCA